MTNWDQSLKLARHSTALRLAGRRYPRTWGLWVLNGTKVAPSNSAAPPRSRGSSGDAPGAHGQQVRQQDAVDGRARLGLEPGEGSQNAPNRSWTRGWDSHVLPGCFQMSATASRRRTCAPWLSGNSGSTAMA